MKDKKVLDTNVSNLSYNSHQVINSVLNIPAVAFNGASEVGKLFSDRSSFLDKLRSGSISGSDVYEQAFALKGKYDVTEFHTKEGMALANLINIAMSPYVDPKLKEKWVYPELSKVNAANAAKGKAQIDLPGVTKVTSSLLSGKGATPATGPGSIEDQVSNILNQLSTTLSSGSKSVTEDDMMYTRRVDELGKLRTRGIVNALQGLPVQSVGSVQLSAPTLGGK